MHRMPNFSTIFPAKDNGDIIVGNYSEGKYVGTMDRAGLLVLGAAVGSVGAHLQMNAILALAGVMMALGMVASAFTEGGGR